MARVTSTLIVVAFILLPLRAAAQCVPSPSGLTGWWPGDGSGADIVGGRTATLMNGAVATGSGQVGQAFQLDGVNDFINVPDAAALNPGIGDFTIEFWVKFNSTANEQILAEKYIETFNPATSTGWLVNKNAQNFLSGSLCNNTAPLSWSIGTWYHIAARRKGTTTSVFRDGVLVGTCSIAQTVNFSSTSSLKFGHRGSPSDTPGSSDTRGFYMNGLIDEVDYFVGRALCDSEIAALAAAGTNGKCKTPVAAVCGDGIISVGETCEDGNTTGGDGCSATCTVEPGWSCNCGVCAPCATPPAQMVGWWSADTTTADRIGGNTGILRNGATYAAGMVGSAFTLDGINDYVEIPDAASLRITGTVTLDAWVKRGSLTDTAMIAVKGGDWNGGQTNYGLALHPAPELQRMFYFFYDGGYRGAAGVSDLNWHHYAAVATQGAADPTLYIDGVPVPVLYRGGTATINLTASTLPLYVGAQIDPVRGTHYSKNTIDELEIFNRGLSASEIAGIHSAGSFGKCAGCGNGLVEFGEACDDGNNTSGDCCSSGCQLESAGSFCGSSSDTACDNPDTCNASGSCLANNEANGSPCGDQGMDCRVDDTCQAGSCQNNGFATAGSACGSSSNTACDDPDTCSATGACLANNEANGSPCGDQGVECRVDDTCQAGSCQDNGFESAGNACGSGTTTDCDNADTCNGSGTCSANNVANGTTCTSDGNACTVDECSSGTCGHAAGNTGAVCRASAGDCDPQETCSGVSTTCPADSKDPSGTACTDDGNDCTNDQCNGSSALCQHPNKSAGSACGSGSNNECDNADTCNGSGTCSANNVANGTACTSDGNVCTVDQCSAGTCAHPAGSPGTVCRAAAGPCDQQETCTGASTTCPSDGVTAAGTPCTADANDCTDDQCDGSSATCQHPNKSSGSPCADGSDTACTDPDTCNGSGVCLANHASDGLACGDQGVSCTVNDACQAGLCQDGGFVASGTACGDGSNTDCTNPDTCSGFGQCLANHEASGTPCTDEPDVCTDDTCNAAGVCTHTYDQSNAPSCAATTTTSTTTTTMAPFDDCAPQPRTGCLVAAKLQLQVDNDADPARDRLLWKWKRGEEFAQTDLGDPTTTTSYFLCIYDQTASVAALVGELAIDPNAAWMSKAPKGFAYKDGVGAEDGVEKAKLKTGETGKTSGQIKATGMNLRLPPAIGGGWYFDQDPSVIVQLGNSEGLCLTSEFELPSLIVSDETQFKAKVP